MLSDLEMNQVFTHYQQRLAAHIELLQFFKTENVDDYTNLALGITKAEGNYSASEHHLGPQVLNNNSVQSVFDLAKNLVALYDADHIPRTIYQANMPYLRISLGSEMAMMLNPDQYWVGNVRTIYSHLMLKHGGNQARADEELRLYRDPDGTRPSQMEYLIWRDIYLSLEKSLNKIASMGSLEAKAQGTPIGEHTYMWADTICSHLYSNHA